jgi:uncharacterized tellurite resistance protein B-like protein
VELDLCVLEKERKMKELKYNERIAVMRILLDIIMADNRIDGREKQLFEETGKELGLDESAKQGVESLNSLLALAIIHDFTLEQKAEFAKLMGRMIVVDKDINYNEVKIYHVVNEFCHINVEFKIDDYPEYTLS